MNGVLLTETAGLTLGMLAACLLPLALGKTERWSSLIFLFGTGALLGICAFDLLPDIFEMGGPKGLSMTVLIGAVYSLAHLIHLRHHQTTPSNAIVSAHHHPQFRVFYLSILGHCFASGVLLSASLDISEKLANAVFLALLAHKGYECLIFVSILSRQQLGRVKNALAVGIYCLALPVGVALTYFFREQLSQSIAFYISSIAVGSLLGCLVFDFAIPCFYQIREKWLQAAWVLLGLILTRFLLGHA